MMVEIERLAREHAEARERLAERLRALEAATAELKRRHIRAIKGALGTAANTEAALRAAIASAPGEFAKPRTRILHGLRVGIMKGRGKLAWNDPARVVRLIRRHRPDDVETLVIVKESPNRPALNRLPAAELKKLGIQMVDSGDEVTIKAAASEVDKWVDTMLAGIRAELDAGDE